MFNNTNNYIEMLDNRFNKIKITDDLRLYSLMIQSCSKKKNIEAKSIFVKDGRSRIVFYPVTSKDSIKIYNIELIINIKDILYYSDYNKVSINEAVCKILAHEAMHIVLGHFNAKYKDHDKEILNIAGDLEINQIINMHSPAVQPEDYDMPNGLNTDEYYELLMKSKENNKNFNTTTARVVKKFGINGDLVESFKDMKEIKEEEVAEIFSEMDDEIFSNMYSNSLTAIYLKQILSNTEYSAKKINGFEEVVKNIVHKEMQTQIVRVEKKEDWMKFNNRRTKTRLLRPGKKIQSSGVKLKHDRTPIIFMDFSSSTRNINNTLVWAANELSRKCNATIVYYCHKIIKVDFSGSPVMPPVSTGLTNLLNSIKEYEKDYAKLGSFEQLKKIYVITDGRDPSIRSILCDYDSRVWLIEKDNIIEMTL